MKTEFGIQLTANIRDCIREAKRDGIVSMTLTNLMQCVRTPYEGTSLKGAPCGTNARWMYAQIFEGIAREEFSDFLI